MKNTKRHLLKSTLLLLWSFVFGCNASTVLHELGHAIAYWTTGGTVEGIIIHPFSWSYCIPGSISDYPSFTTWGGVVFGTLMGLLLVMAVWRWRGPYVILVIMTGVVSCIHNGGYLIYDCLTTSDGDATILISYGTSKLLIIAVGLFMMGIGVILAGICPALIGIGPNDGVKLRILVFSGGILPYTFVQFIYDLLYNKEELGQWLIYWVIIVGLVFLVAVLSKVVLPRIRWLGSIEPKAVTWPSVVVANNGAFVILSIIFILLIQYIPRTTTRYTLGYYDHQSNFAGVKLKMEDNPTASPARRYESESIIFWSWDGREGKREIPNLLAYFATVCPQTLAVIVQAMDGVLVIPMDGKPHRWIFKEDGFLLHFKWAVSACRCRLLVYGMDPNLREYVLIALDILNGRTTKFEIADTPWEMIFIDDNTAVASVGEDLIRVEFAESGDHKFSVEPGAAKQGAVKAVYKGEFVFHSPVFWTEDNADQQTIECGDMKISFTDPVLFVLASKSYIWAIDTKGQVFRLNSDGSKLCVGTYAPERMIGRGSFDDGLWIAFLDGTVTVFGDSKKETAKIELP